MQSKETQIKELIFARGADVCGIAGVERFAGAPEGFSPTDIFAGCRAAVVFGKALPKGLSQVPSRLVYGHYNAFLCGENDRTAYEGALAIERAFPGATAVPLPSDGPYEYWDSEHLTGRGLLSMKHAAVLAGLGTLGKSTLLISPRYGNQLVLGAVLTDLELASDPLCEELCIPGCRRCLDACPVHAIADGRVDQSLCRPNSYGQTARGFSTVDCNRCRMVCPRRFGLAEAQP